MNRTNELDSRFIYTIINEQSETFLGAERMPVNIQRGGVFICQEGETDIALDLKSYHLKQGDICVVFPSTLLQIVSRSTDLKGLVMSVNMEFIRDIRLASNFSYYLYIKDNPCTSLNEQEMERILELSYAIVRNNAREGHPFKAEITENLLMVVCYELASIYTGSKPIAQQKRSRNDIVFQQFVFSLAKNYKISREVSYYADEQFITPRYLSSIIKNKTGKSASEWIIDTVIVQAKHLLQHTDLTVQQITDELNFPNPSFFCQYFKKYVGETPNGFRNHQQ